MIYTVDHSTVTPYLIPLVSGPDCAKFLEEMLSNYWISRDLVELRNDSIGQSSCQDQKSNRIGIIFLFATTCIMLCCRNDIKDPNPYNSQWDQILINFFTLFSMFNYLTICALLCNVRMCNPKLILTCLMFVFISGLLFAYLRSVNPGIPDLTFVRDCRETFLVMDAFGLFIFFLATFVNPTVNKQISDIDTEEKKAGGTKLLNKVNLKNYNSTKLLNKLNLKYYASMDDTEALIEI